VSYLKPIREDEKYFKIKSNVSGKLMFLRSQSCIDIYDLNYQRLKTLTMNEESFCGFDCFIEGFKDFLVVRHYGGLQVYQIVGLESTTELVFQYRSKNNTNKVLRNPIVDYIYLSKKKYGDSPSFIGSPGKHILITDFSKRKTEELGNCLDTVGIPKVKLKSSFDWKSVAQVNSDTFARILGSRVPVHLATIENSTLTPLRNGKNFSENISRPFEESQNIGGIIQYLVSIIRFAQYESLLENWTRKISVVSIIGRQSSGQSYLLNRLFGTRFNVAANRGTDGIWMSSVVLKGGGCDKHCYSEPRLEIVLDCEVSFRFEGIIRRK
jgi:hypothetical protein